MAVLSRTRPLTGTSTSAVPVTRVVRAVLTALLVLALALFILGPLLWLAVRAFATDWTYPRLLPDGWTLHWWQQVFADARLSSSIGLSLAFALTTLAVSCRPGTGA